MVDIKQSIRTFKKKFSHRATELTNNFNDLVGDSISSIYYIRNYDNEKPIIIENGKCHHVPYAGIVIDLESGKRVLIYDSNEFSEYGGTFGVNIKNLEHNQLNERCINHKNDSNWINLMNTKIKSINIIWIDDDGWNSPKEVKGQFVLIPNEKSNGIYPHGIEIFFENNEVIYILAIEPDEYVESKKRFKYLNGSEEFVIAFNKNVALKQKILIEGINLML